jgi:hypothetical protein
LHRYGYTSHILFTAKMICLLGAAVPRGHEDPDERPDWVDVTQS